MSCCPLPNRAGHPVASAAMRAAALLLALAAGWLLRRRRLLTAAEKQAVDLLGRAYTLIAGLVVADGPTCQADLAELRGRVHDLQRAVMANAAARAYPALFRRLGGTVRPRRRRRFLRPAGRPGGYRYPGRVLRRN